MITINALNKFLISRREELSSIETGNFVIIKKKDKALFVGPLKKFTLQVWYVKSRKEKYNVLNITLNKTSLNDNTDSIIWDLIEEELLLYFYSNIQSEIITKFITNSFSTIETKEIDMNNYDTSK